MEVRRVGVEDWEAIRDLRLRALTDSPTAFGSNLPRELAFGEDDWRRRAGNGGWFVAFDAADRTVGLVCGVRGEGCHEVVSMWVDPAARGGGVGARLLDAVRGWAVGEGASTLVLGVTEGNDAARRLYVRSGFAPTGNREPHWTFPELWIEQLALPLVEGEAQPEHGEHAGEALP